MKILIGLLIVLMLVGCTDQVIGPMAKNTLPVETVVDHTAAPTVIPTPTVKKEWVITNTWSGNGIKTTENFDITENARINWETTESKGNMSVFQIYVQDSGGEGVGVAANVQGDQKDVSYLHLAPGKYSLMINSANTKWTITIEQQK